MKPYKNILVRLDRIHRKCKLGETEIFIDTTYESQDWISTTGTVEGSGEEGVEAGDRIWVEYREILLSLGRIANPAQEHSTLKYYKEGEDYLIFVRKSACYMIERDGEKIMLNGNLLVQPIYEKANMFSIDEDLTPWAVVVVGEYEGEDLAGKTIIQGMRGANQSALLPLDRGAKKGDPMIVYSKYVHAVIG